ncbi:MAG TPA: hypothetical protein VMZ53_04365 [Kofleriaceae bacterium]|nr:hypothetical protein [Kofleriaceae bacterium]
MTRLASLLCVITAACGGGTATGEASLSNTMPPVKSAAAKPFTGADGAGAMVLGWKIELYSDDAGASCTEASKVGTIGIYSNQAAGSGPQALLSTGFITIVTASPPTVLATAAANLSVEGVSIMSGGVELTEFHLTADAKHADRLAGTINAGGTDAGTGADVTLTGMFTAPICEEE